MASSHDKNGRPIVVVTGMGVITSLGAGKADNWAKLTAGESGIHRITRFANEGLKTTIAGSVDFIPVETVAYRTMRRNSSCPVSSPNMAGSSVPVRRISLRERQATCASPSLVCSRGFFRQSPPSQRP